MPSPSTLVELLSIKLGISTATGIFVFANIKYLDNGDIKVWKFLAPRNIPTWGMESIKRWVHEQVYNRIESLQKAEIDETLRLIREGENPLRSLDGTPQGTRHLRYDEIAYHIYHRLMNSQDPHDKVVAAQLIQNLTDEDLMSITQLDMPGIASLRNKAAKALQAASLMRQAGGVI